MQDLNPRQREAVRYLDGPSLVLAGAGSGKTRVITAKIAHLIRHAGMSPRQIYAVTFTNKAAREMKARVGKLLADTDTCPVPQHDYVLALLIGDGHRVGTGYLP